ncbi:MAG: hypothetical protein ACKVW3_02740 [Phycisphaerales bacterium]
MTKSALRLTEEALVIARASLPAYAHPFSRHDFTLHQLFAILVLRQFLRLDYHGVVAAWSDLRSRLALEKVPDHSPRWYAERKLLERGPFSRLLSASLDRARTLGLIEHEADDRTAAIDSSGLEVGLASLHVRRRARRLAHDVWHAAWPQLTAVFHAASQLIAGIVTSRVPSRDSPEFGPAVRRVASNFHPRRVVARVRRASDPQRLALASPNSLRAVAAIAYSTVTLLARFRGLSTS